VTVLGLIVNIAVDFDNAYDMTLATLWGLTLLPVLEGVLVGSRKSAGT